MADPKSYLDMSDEDMLKAGPPTETPAVTPEPPVVEEVPAVVVETPPVEEVPADTPPVEPETPPDDDDLDGDKTKATDPGAEGTKGEGADDGKEVKEGKKPVPEDAGDKKPVETPKEEPKVDFEAEYKRLVGTFKANGRDITVKNTDDAIALMQMGANYNKKMAALKPVLKLVKLLENNGLMDESKLSFLIDLDKKNPDAITKLVKDSGINPMDLDTEKSSEYKPKTQTVDDREVELDTVLDELQGSPAYNRTLEVVSKEWDGPSKQVIASQPQLLKVINGHIESGIYDVINKEVENERMLGRLNGLSNIEAYRQVGDAIQARGGFAHLGATAPKDQQNPATPVVVTPKPKKEDDDELKNKRRAASVTKPVAPASATPGKEFNPLALSDDEFLKNSAKRFS